MTSYDFSGQQFSYGFDSMGWPDELTKTGSSFSYDSNGNLTKMPGPGCTLNLAYDPYNRLQDITTASCGSESYAYSPDSRPVWKKT